MNGEELRRCYAAGERDFSDLDLRGVNVSGIAPDLDIVAYDDPCPDLAANLSEINLSGSDLTNAILSGANLSNANLSNANLTNAGLERCNLTNTNLRGANLTEASLCRAELDGTNMSRANLTRAYMASAKFYRKVDMSRANLLHADISYTDFAADVTGAINVSTVNFDGSSVDLILDDRTVIKHDPNC